MKDPSDDLLEAFDGHDVDGIHAAFHSVVMHEIEWLNTALRSAVHQRPKPAMNKIFFGESSAPSGPTNPQHDHRTGLTYKYL